MNADVLLAAGVSTLAQVYLRSKEFEIFMTDSYDFRYSVYTKTGVSPVYMPFWLVMKPLCVLVFFGTRSSNDRDANTSILFLALVMAFICEVLTPNSLNSRLDPMNTFFNVVGWIVYIAGIGSRLGETDRVHRQRLNEPRRNNDHEYILQY